MMMSILRLGTIGFVALHDYDTVSVILVVAPLKKTMQNSCKSLRNTSVTAALKGVYLQYMALICFLPIW